MLNDEQNFVQPESNPLPAAAVFVSTYCNTSFCYRELTQLHFSSTLGAKERRGYYLSCCSVSATLYSQIYSFSREAINQKMQKSVINCPTPLNNLPCIIPPDHSISLKIKGTAELSIGPDWRAYASPSGNEFQRIPEKLYFMNPGALYRICLTLTPALEKMAYAKV